MSMTWDDWIRAMEAAPNCTVTMGVAADWLDENAGYERECETCEGYGLLVELKLTPTVFSTERLPRFCPSCRDGLAPGDADRDRLRAEALRLLAECGCHGVNPLVPENTLYEGQGVCIRWVASILTDVRTDVVSRRLLLIHNYADATPEEREKWAATTRANVAKKVAAS